MKTSCGEARETLQLVSFPLGGQYFGLEVADVHEIVVTTALARPPATPLGLAGLLNLRRTWIPVVDLRARLGLPADAVPEEYRILILEIRGVRLGIAVNAVSEVVRVPRQRIGPPPVAAASDIHWPSAAVRHGNRRLILLDIARLFGHEELAALANLAGAGPD